VIAASAEDASVGGLHYDDDFDVLAGVLSFREPLDRRARLAATTWSQVSRSRIS
jgi:hypothetical protein